MLNREIAQEQLKTFHTKDWRSQRVQQTGDLPEPLRTIGYGILGYGADAQKLPPTEMGLTQARSHQQFDQLTPDERYPIFRVWFPTFAPTVEAAWQLLGQLSYQWGYDRRSFRAPNHPEFCAFRRYQWLQRLIHLTEDYHQDLAWFAAWTPYLGYGAGNIFGILFAAAIDQHDDLGETIFKVLTASAHGTHDIGAMGQHVTCALLVANQPDGWEVIEQLLLTAQRQEGLRQTILETVDEAHPRAFRRMLRLILDHQLTRFSATIRAVDVWFGFALESVDEKAATHMIRQVLELLDDSDAQAAALKSPDPQLVYLALWAVGFVDVAAAMNCAVPLLEHETATHRFVAVHFLAQLEVTPARFLLLSALGDRDLSVVAAAVQALGQVEDTAIQHESDLFERLEEVLPRFPARGRARSMVWPWIKIKPSQSFVASVLLRNLGGRSSPIDNQVVPCALFRYIRSIAADCFFHLPIPIPKQPR
ncbi:HEAT repeat domain-containing protein [Leptolyngbya sp. AN02str]|uniref:HEAT repeat domain-containing protein n=1 Tax=Leptolyngbya sp. AN02str TaxID=3423363 RepID=UPI003D32142A